MKYLIKFQKFLSQFKNEMSWEVPSLEEEAPEMVCILAILVDKKLRCLPKFCSFVSPGSLSPSDMYHPNFCGGCVHLHLLRERGKMNVCVCSLVNDHDPTLSVVSCEKGAGLQSWRDPTPYSSAR
ncbi:hypothetical protein ACH5RR_036364 [Cinchona calisaya]|uniref:Uncharacterized protein n=1 Tax=Cinchona calisaya TaxID=153742 RepID=A0ABD2Y6W5_9GENT